jgi:phage baseplate assembly protein W
MPRLFYGVGLNFGKARNGYFSVSSDKKLIKESLTSILLTKPGERLHLPDYGVGLELYVFEQNDEVLEDILRTKIIDQVTKWEPGVDIVDISFRRDDNNLIIRLTVQMKDFGGVIENIEYSVSG